MAKKSVIARNDKRAKKIEKYKSVREEYKAIIKNPEAPIQERMAAHIKMQKLPKDSSRVRYRNRCCVTGRGRGVYFGFISRLELIRRVNSGNMPGFKKASSV